MKRNLGVLFGIVVMLAGFAWFGLHRMKQQGAGSRCCNNLKQISLSAGQYADDKRYYPHVGARGKWTLDGDGDTSDGPRAIRSLTYFNYCDNPEVYVCPDSLDQAAPLTDEAKADPRCFGWEGTIEDKASAPISGGARDRPLSELTTLSYAWTRFAFSMNDTSSVLAGDRASCNHAGAFNLVTTSGHTLRTSRDGYLSDVTAHGAALGTLLEGPHPPNLHRIHELLERAPFALVFLGLVIVELFRSLRPHPSPPPQAGEGVPRLAQ